MASVVALTAALLHVLDRQIEFTSRADFLWTAKLKNILPAHVAEHFLSSARVQHVQELYHERYSCIAVMFASIPNYKEFYDENDVEQEDVETMRGINKILLENILPAHVAEHFLSSARVQHVLLLKPKFSGIEKIKTIGRYNTKGAYRRGLGRVWDRFDDDSRPNQQGIFSTISPQGLNHGPVIAGVVGAQKPQYDIWGNTVNVASRMDSCGVMGRMQVTEDTAKILMSCGYECESRGPIYVKGKGTLPTYFVKTPFDSRPE
ncbi:hypothetical protein B566_EDAN017937 [Ephemera danica]|nr:hypothetical protein B566_EDAN017937 [Ephemera danica]